MGHLRVYTIADVLSRYHRVKHPIGWDSFGLPAENAARVNNKDPEEWTNQNIAQMKNQLLKMNINFGWDREFKTSDDKYYKWTQYIFLKLYENGLVYQKESVVNWDPVDETVLANEQVVNGRGERSGALVEKRYLKQWYFRITRYADRLFNDLDVLDWPDAVKQQQRNWIKPKTSKLVRFKVGNFKLDCFVEGKGSCYFIAVGPQHHLVKGLSKEIQGCINSMKPSGGLEGIFTGLYASNDEIKNIPIHVTNFVQEGCEIGTDTDPVHLKYIQQNTLDCVGELLSDNCPTVVRYQLRDWLVSRQRNWGTPIPIIHCPSCNTVPIPEKDLPLRLRDKQKKPKCPECNREAEYETDTMDTFVDSSWYWIRFLDAHNDAQLIAKDKVQGLPVDIYIGGIEHSIMHLLYARFIAKFLTDINLIDIPNGEPFKQLLTQGMVTGITYKCTQTSRYVPSTDIEYIDSQPRVKSTKNSVKVTFEKMSKSKFNGINPHDMILQYGTDVTRLFILYKAPPQDELAWDSTAIVGMQRFVNRVREIVQQPPSSNPSVDAIANSAIIKVTSHIEKFRFNLAITELMKLAAKLSTNGSTEATKRLLEMLSIFAPETALQLYNQIEPCSSLEFPTALAVEQEKSTFNVMVNGKQVKEIQLDGLADEEIQQKVLDQLELAQHKKVIINKSKKIVNILI
ncbi:hypothetical protein HDV01_002723 [Terramyces sp. JEL0728]|nr:hypothetical protein HDV01_002723 [Terramyces sp. JEL0728]